MVNQSQQYFSTRSADVKRSFEHVVLEGLSPEGGLYIPSAIPQVSKETLDKWKSLEFHELAAEIMSLYISEEEISRQDLGKLTRDAYSTFRSKQVTPLVSFTNHPDIHILELFHGPTYAFKDVALQFAGKLFEYFLTRRNQNKSADDPTRETITVIGATSGDTGSAAIYGLRNKKDVSVFILYPTGRVSPIQEMQMTTVLDDNVHTLSVNGTFDDCQDLVKQAFTDKEFNDKVHVGAVNSINWARILAQITYYFYSYFQVENLGKNKPITYVVPTGNFGDILAGFYAKKMGLNISDLVIATNENDILYRFFQSGEYSKSSNGQSAVVHATLSPAMDILVSSNFERFLWYAARESIADNDQAASNKVSEWMNQLKSSGNFNVPSEVYEVSRKYFSATRTTDEQTIETIREIYHTISPKYLIDPHSAIAVSGALKLDDNQHSLVCLSTAHPAKFADAVNQALKGVEGYSFEEDVLPEEFKDMMKQKSKKIMVEKADIEEIKRVILEELEKGKRN